MKDTASKYVASPAISVTLIRPKHPYYVAKITSDNLASHLIKAADERRMADSVVMKSGYVLALAQSTRGTPILDNHIKQFLDCELAPIKPAAILLPKNEVNRDGLNMARAMAKATFKSHKLIVADAQDENLVTDCIRQAGMEGRTRFVIFENSSRNSDTPEISPVCFDERGRLVGAMHVNRNLRDAELCVHLDKIFNIRPVPKPGKPEDDIDGDFTGAV